MAGSLDAHIMMQHMPPYAASAINPCLTATLQVIHMMGKLVIRDEKAARTYNNNYMESWQKPQRCFSFRTVLLISKLGAQSGVLASISGVGSWSVMAGGVYGSISHLQGAAEFLRNHTHTMGPRLGIQWYGGLEQKL